MYIESRVINIHILTVTDVCLYEEMLQIKLRCDVGVTLENLRHIEILVLEISNNPNVNNCIADLFRTRI